MLGRVLINKIAISIALMVLPSQSQRWVLSFVVAVSRLLQFRFGSVAMRKNGGDACVAELRLIEVKDVNECRVEATAVTTGHSSE